jgi:hypothetical protein
LRTPLNDILSTEVNVRVLRVLSSSQSPLGKSEVARRAALNPSGVRRSVADLVECGILEPVGVGRRQLVTMRGTHPLAPALKSLFESERDVFAQFLDSLRATVGQLQPPPDSAWIEGPAAQGNDRPRDTIVLGLLASARDVDAIARELDSRTIDIMGEYDVIIEVKRWTAADLATAPRPQWSHEEEVISLLGPPPISFVQQESWGVADGSRRPRTHRDLDRRALTLARVIADRLVEDPSLVSAARDLVVKRMRHATPRERKDLDEWQKLLERLSVQQLRNFLVHSGERATRLRQSLPFVEVLSKEERHSILENTNGD